MTGSTWRRRTFASLSQPLFRRYYAAILFHFGGFWMRIAATGWFVYDMTGSYERLGLITAASLLPWVPIAPLAGVLADRVDQRPLLVRIGILVCLANAALGAGILLGRVAWTELLLATIVIGCLHGVFAPARHAILRRMVEVSDLGNAIGLSAAAFHFMHFAGFAAAGFVYWLAGPAACFFVVGGASAAMAILLHRLDLPPQARGSEHHPGRDLVIGFRYVWDHRLTRSLVLSASGVVCFLLSFRALMPAITKDRLLLGPLGYGLVMAAAGAGSFLGALWVASGSGGRSRRVATMFAVVWVCCGAVLAIAWTPYVWLCAPAMLLAGFCHVGFMANANTTVQEAVPDHLRARVMGIWGLIFGAAFPLGTILMGWGAERAGTEWAITAGVGVALTLSLAFFLTSRRRLAVAVDDEVRQSDEQIG